MLELLRAGGEEVAVYLRGYDGDHRADGRADDGSRDADLGSQRHRCGGRRRAGDDLRDG